MGSLWSTLLVLSCGILWAYTILPACSQFSYNYNYREDSPAYGTRQYHRQHTVGPPYAAPSAAPPKSPATLQQDFLKLFDGGQNDLPTYDPNGYSRDPGCGVHPADLKVISSLCPKKDFFYGMNPQHMSAVMSVKAVMMASRTASDVICAARVLRDSVNPEVWLRGLMSTVLARADLEGLHRPSLVEIMPSMLVNDVVLNEAQRLAQLPPGARGEGCVVLDGTVGRDNGVENLLWYFREDVGLNTHHWYWHLANPFSPMTSPTPPARPDRRGELFYYVHSSMLARYHTERLANGLPKVVPLKIELNTIVAEPYYAHLSERNAGNRWTDRPPNQLVRDARDTRNPNMTVVSNIAERLIRQQRVIDSINSGALLAPDNSLIPLNNRYGIDLLAEVVEASIYSVNPGFYGDFGIHNEGHILFGRIQDPQGMLGLPPGVMADAATAMRDPVFYRYHSVPIGSLFDKHKNNLEPYAPSGGELPLLWPGIRILSARVISTNGLGGVRGPNELGTFWNHVTYDVSRGLDFNRSAAANGPLNVCLRHLDHDNFEYEIEVEKDPFVTSRSATVRIYMAPHLDESGTAYSAFDQRTLFFPLDIFKVQRFMTRCRNPLLEAGANRVEAPTQGFIVPGPNLIRRRSLDTALTIPWAQSLHELDRDLTNQSPYCGCGWPHHLLLPKGNRLGMLFDIFVMLTNGEEDVVPQPAPARAPGTGNPCKPAFIYCGVANQLYPDSRPMGYPFDRLPYQVQEVQTNVHGGQDYGPPRQVRDIQEFVHGIPNMNTFQVRITHSSL